MALSEFMFNSMRKNLDLKKVEDKTTFTKNIIPLIEKIPNGLYKKLLKEQLLDITKLSEADLFLKEKSLKNQNSMKNNVVLNNLELTDSLILSIFLEHPILLEQFSKQIIDIVKDPDVKEMLVSIQRYESK